MLPGLPGFMRGLGSENIDYRLRNAEFASPAEAGKARWLGTSIVTSLRELLRDNARVECSGIECHAYHNARDAALVKRPKIGHRGNTA